MARCKLNTKGFDEYFERLAAIDANIDAIADEALTEGGQVLVDGMIRRAAERTGNLKEHIGMEGPFGDGAFHWAKVGILNADRETELYFFYQEVGTSSMPAHPYIRPTFDEDMRAARAKMVAVFKRRGAL